MTKEPASYRVTVIAAGRREIEFQLERAVQRGIIEALKHKSRGMLVTRHNYTTFTVELSRDVPFGLTVERDRFQRPSKRTSPRQRRGLSPAPALGPAPTGPTPPAIWLRKADQ